MGFYAGVIPECNYSLVIHPHRVGMGVPHGYMNIHILMPIWVYIQNDGLYTMPPLYHAGGMVYLRAGGVTRESHHHVVTTLPSICGPGSGPGPRLSCGSGLFRGIYRHDEIVNTQNGMMLSYHQYQHYGYWFIPQQHLYCRPLLSCKSYI